MEFEPHSYSIEFKNGRYELTSPETGQVAAFKHKWIAGKANEIANDLGLIANPSRDWIVKFNRELFSLQTKVVPCSYCFTEIGEHCKRSSGHQTFYGEPHVSRWDAFDEWLIKNHGLPDKPLEIKFRKKRRGG